MTPLAHLTVLLAALAPLAASAPSPSPADVEVEAPPRWSDIKFSGNGCPQGHAPKLTYEDGNSLETPITLTFGGRFRASTTPDKTNRMSACQIHISTRSSGGKGWQLALSDVWAEGKGSLAPKASLEYYSTVFFSADAEKTQTLDGALKNTKDSSISVPLEVHSSPGDNSLWSACSSDGHIANVIFRIVLPDKGTSNFEVSSEKLAFKWKRC
ncbi:hypothetical protein RB595_009020 [Gaeumannomyces hyphopodioides]